GNNTVDAGDYVLWRKTLGTPVAQFSGADGNGNSAIDTGDYDVWRGHFGAPPAAGYTVDLAATDAVQRIDDGLTDAGIDGALLAPPTLLTSRHASSMDSSGANLSCASRAQSSINLEQRDEALLAITSSPDANELCRSAASRRVHPDGKDTTQ